MVSTGSTVDLVAERFHDPAHEKMSICAEPPRPAAEITCLEAAAMIQTPLVVATRFFSAGVGFSWRQPFLPTIRVPAERRSSDPYSVSQTPDTLSRSQRGLRCWSAA